MVNQSHEGGVFIGLGSNVGDREGHIRASLRELSEHANVELLRCSSLHETTPVGGPSGQEMYLNAAAEIATSLAPEALLAWLHEIERRHGRLRQTRWGPRTLDLDLLLFHDRFIDRPKLTVPHPRMWARDFVMTPLREICPAGLLESMRARIDRSHAEPTSFGSCGLSGRCEHAEPRPSRWPR